MLNSVIYELGKEPEGPTGRAKIPTLNRLEGYLYSQGPFVGLGLRQRFYLLDQRLYDELRKVTNA